MRMFDEVGYRIGLHWVAQTKNDKMLREFIALYSDIVFGITRLS